MSATEREARKTDIQRGEDIIYPVNHATLCGVFDVVLNTPVEMATQHLLGKRLSISHCPGCASGEHDTSHHSKDSLATTAGRWIGAELLGDWLGIIPTVLVQRHAPVVMESIGQGLTYAAGDFFYAGAKKAAEDWGHKHGFEVDSTEVKGRTREIYNHEMSHIAQAGVWTFFSMGITLAALRAMGDDTPLWINATSKLTGASTSFFTLLGARAAFPDKAREWDHWASKHIALPTTNIMGRMFGIEGKVIEDVQQQKEEYATGGQWLR